VNTLPAGMSPCRPGWCAQRSDCARGCMAAAKREPTIDASAAVRSPGWCPMFVDLRTVELHAIAAQPRPRAFGAHP